MVLSLARNDQKKKQQQQQIDLQIRATDVTNMTTDIICKLSQIISLP